MRTFSLGFVNSPITQWDKSVRNERVVQVKNSRNWWNRRDEPKETGHEHYIRHSRCALHGNFGHSLGHVVGKVEGLPNGQGVEHVAKAKIYMISISYCANDIGSKQFFPFLELGLEFIEFHSIWVLVDLISGSGSPSVVVLMKRWSRSLSLETRGVSQGWIWLMSLSRVERECLSAQIQVPWFGTPRI